MAKINEDIPVCMYAGDPEDEFCSACNGKTMEIDGQVFSCTECEGYTYEKKATEKPVQLDEAPQATTESDAVDTYVSQGITTSIKAESGVSIETKRGWYRFSFTEERIIPESADMEKEKEALWNSVNSEVDRQIEEIKLLIG